MGHVAIFHVLNAEERRTHSERRSVKDGIAEAKLRRVLNHSHLLITLDRIILHRIDGHRLEFAPSDGEGDWVA